MMPAPHRRLLIAEKPAQGRALADALLLPGELREEENLIIGRTADGAFLACAWASGHLLRIGPPESQNPGSVAFRWEDLPLVPAAGRFRYACVEGKATWLRRIGELSGQADEIVNACDGAREGELIFAEIMMWVGIDPDAPNVRRLWITDTTCEGLRHAWARASPSAKFRRLRAAAWARAEADWIWGFSSTRMVTLAFPPPERSANRAHAVWPIGRVQTPVLAVIEERCLEIAAFCPETFWRMEAEFSGEDHLRFRAWLVAPDSLRFGHTETHFHRSPATSELRRLLLIEAGVSWQVEDAREEGFQSPPPLFDLVDLQRSCNRLWGWTAAYTLQIAQRLYERDHAISYPRTDSAALPTTMRAEIQSRFTHLWTDWALRDWPRLGALPEPKELGDEHFSDERVTDHYAIVPTGLLPAMAANEPGRVRPERTLWELITTRFLLAWLPPARIDHCRRVLRRENDSTEGWRAILESDPVLDPGWLSYEEAMFNTTGIGPPLAQRLAEKVFPPTAANAFLRELRIRLGHTSAPHYYNDDLLLQKMVALGLGTSSTRADVIVGLEDSGLIERGTIGARFLTTRRGAQLIALLRESPAAVFTDAKETGAWERQLELVERRREPMNRAQFLENLVQRLRGVKAAIQAGNAAAPMAFCPDTGRPIREESDRWIFPPGSRLAAVRCPKLIAQRPMTAGDYVQVLLSGSRGGGPFDGFVGRKGPFACWLVFNRRERRFAFLFKRRGLGQSARTTPAVRYDALPLSRHETNGIIPHSGASPGGLGR
jgi:DNA topoisomerase-3